MNVFDQHKLEVMAFESLRDNMLFRRWVEAELEKARAALDDLTDPPSIYRAQGQARVFRRLQALLNNPSA